MSLRPTSAFRPSSCFALAAALTLGACGESSTDEDNVVEGTSGSGGASAAAGQGPAGSAGSSPLGSSSGSMNNGPPAGAGAGSSDTPKAGAAGAGGSATPAAGGTGGTGGTGAAGGGVTPAEGGAGGSVTPAEGGAGGMDASAGAGAGWNGECTRDYLDGLADDYFAALAAGDPSSLPLAATVKFTENAEEAEIGTTAFWMNAGEAKYSQRALDTEACSVAAQAVVPEGGTDLPIALRLKVEGGELTEVETIVVRQGDYTASFAVDSNPQAIIAIADSIGWHDEVPEADRATRAELTAWVDKYFRAFPSGVCAVTGDCKRLENGGGNFSCNTGASCTAGDPGPGGTFTPRVIVVDELRGIAAGLTIFDFQTTGHLDMHMIKMSGGEVHAVQALLRNTDGQSGWE